MQNEKTEKKIIKNIDQSNINFYVCSSNIDA